LVLGESVERELVTGDRHAYPLRLEAGQFLLATVEQRGIDAYVTILDTLGKVLASGEGQGGMNGVDFVSFFPETTGWYWIAVLPPSAGTVYGSYTVTIERLEPAATSPTGRVDQLFAAWDRRGSPGAAVAVVRDGELSHSNGYGLAQLEYDIPIEPTTVFHVASVSKQFTAFAVLMLAADGRLSLDDDVRTYLPELHDFGHTITIRHLLHHTSGLRDQWSLLTMAGWRMDDVITHDQILRLLERQRELNFEPGAEYLYTNTGFTLLAEIVERVTGQPFREWTEEHIFEPLAMENTHFHDDHQIVVPNRAYSYQHASEGGFKKAVLSYANVGATSLFTTLEDLARWTLNFETGEVGGPHLIRLMRSRGVLNTGDSLDYAMGQAIGSYRGLLALYHAGADAGYRSYLLRFPHHRVSVVVLANLTSVDAGRLARQVAELYLVDEFGVAVANTSQFGENIGSAFTTDASTIADYLGEYSLGSGVVMAISHEGDRLRASTTGQGEVTLVPVDADRYLVEGSRQYVRFARDTDGTVTELTLEEPGSTRTAPRIEPFDGESIPFPEYVGTFYAEELDATYTLEIVEGALTSTHLRLGSFTLFPRSPDTFLTNQWFMRELKFERNDGGEITGFRASNWRLRNLLFEKRRQ
jgi:CubicO group peptidase (beta-lactamase class C family)